MHWDETEDKSAPLPEITMVDVSFKIKAHFLAVNHHYLLAQEITRHLPWFEQEPCAGIHPIQVAPAAHGWAPPLHHDEAVWQLSKRTRLTLRIPAHRENDVTALQGKRLDVEPEKIEIGACKTRGLAAADPLFSRYVVSEPGVSEPCFVNALMKSLTTHDIRPRKVICGKTNSLRTPHKLIETRSVLVASLNPLASVRLQCLGLGEARRLGCGIFVPHKGIEPFRQVEERD